MLRLALAAVLLAVVYPHQARAQVEPPGAYVETRVGLFKIEDNDGTVFGLDSDLRVDPGWAVEVAAGAYVTDFFRGELAMAWREADIDDLQVLDVDLPLDETDIGIFTAMLNGYFELPLVLGVRPFIGAGAGFAYFDIDLETTAPFVAVDSGNFTFAWQGIAGVAFHITSNIALTGTYSYLGTTNTEEGGLDGLVIKDFRAHTLMAGLRYYF